MNSINKKRLLSLKEFLLQKKSRRASLKKFIEFLYRSYGYRQKKITTCRIDDWIAIGKPCLILPYPAVDGNISSYELMILSTLASQKKRATLLEIGTFNGLTTIHLAINSEKSIIHTLDLHEAQDLSELALDIEDEKFTKHPSKKDPFYRKHRLDNVILHYGDSKAFDFSLFGALDLAFIDGGHSYDVVKSDTEKVLERLNSNGMIIWHDYDPCTPGVFTYLNELSSLLDLKHIEGTSLVIYRKDATKFGLCIPDELRPPG